MLDSILAFIDNIYIYPISVNFFHSVVANRVLWGLCVLWDFVELGWGGCNHIFVSCVNDRPAFIRRAEVPLICEQLLALGPRERWSMGKVEHGGTNQKSWGKLIGFDGIYTMKNLMRQTQCHKPTIWGWFITHKNLQFWGCFSIGFTTLRFINKCL